MPESSDLNSAFHAGEQSLQARLGLQERMQTIAEKVIRPFMPAPHRELFEKLPLVFLGGLDQQQNPWATLRLGQPGFVSSPDEKTLVIQASAQKHDPLSSDLSTGQDLGVLGLEFETRRRNRVSAKITALKPRKLELEVKQSFGNCPKYIKRALLFLLLNLPIRDLKTFNI